MGQRRAALVSAMSTRLSSRQPRSDQRHRITDQRQPAHEVRIGLLAVAAATALWALGATVASDLFSAGVDPLELIEVRTWITAAGLGILALRLHAKRPTTPTLPLRYTIAFGIAVGIANAAFFLAIERLPVAVAIVLQNLAPGLVALWVLLSTRRTPSARTTAALIVALIGVALVAGFPGTTLGTINLVGIGFGLLTAAAVAAFSILGEQSAKTYGAIGSIARAFAIASIAWIAWQLPHGAPELLTNTEHWPAVLIVSIAGTLLPFVLFSWGVARARSQAAAVGVSLEPVFGAAMAWSWLGQPLSVLQLLGGAIVLAGVVYLQRTPTTKKTPTSTTNRTSNSTMALADTSSFLARARANSTTRKPRPARKGQAPVPKHHSRHRAT